MPIGIINLTCLNTTSSVISEICVGIYNFPAGIEWQWLEPQ